MATPSTSLALLFIGLSLAASSNAADFSCPPELGLPHAQVTLFGEIHGSNEAPALVADEVCRRAESGKAVILALEFDVTEQESLEKFLASPGKNADRSALISNVFWQGVQDGRHSIAMFDLIDQVRILRNKGADIRILPTIPAWNGDRDASMANVILEAAEAAPDAEIVGLFGNYHTGKVIGTRRDPDHKRMGYNLLPLAPLAINLGFLSGWTWSCTSPLPACGSSYSWPLPNERRSLGYTQLVNDPDGHDGEYIFPKVTVSPPANTRVDD